jgi:hypothetical protein
MTQEPYPKKKKSPWLWVSLGCITIVAVLGIIMIVTAANFLKSPEGKKMMAGIDRTQDLARVLPDVASGFEKHNAEKGDFPKDLDGLKGYVTETTLQKIKDEMKYTKPAKDAPPTTVVLTTGSVDFMRNTTQEIVLQKNLEYFQLTKAPLEQR